jgi:hypothetical protein
MATGTRLIIADSSQGVEAARSLSDFRAGKSTLVALSAEAAEAADAGGIDHVPACHYVNELQPLSMGQDLTLRRWIDAISELDREVQKVDGGLVEALGAHIYAIACVVNAIRLRGFLVRRVVEDIRPSSVTIIETSVDPCFEHQGSPNPRNQAVIDYLDAVGIESRLLVESASKRNDSLRRAWTGWLISSTTKMARRMLAMRPLQLAAALGISSPRTSSLRVLFSDTLGYGWFPIQRRIHGSGGYVYLLQREPGDPSIATYRPELTTPQGRTIPLRCAGDTGGEEARASSAVSAQFDSWAAKTAKSRALVFDGIDTFGVLLPFLRNLVTTGRGLIDRNDAIVNAALDASRPDAVCFFSISWGYQKRLVYQCRQRGIPVICYQHGGAYGTHDVPTHGLQDQIFADYFMTYGKGITPPACDLLPTRAAYRPVGAAHLDYGTAAHPRALDRAKSGKPLKVLWVGDLALRFWTSGTEIEDTARFRLEKACLRRLSDGHNLAVTYRPFPGDVPAQATPQWLSREGITRIRTNVSGALHRLLLRFDLVITISTSGTVWSEVLARGIPLIAYVNPSYTKVYEEAKKLLRDACIVCESDAEMEAVVEQIVGMGPGFLTRFEGKVAAPFLTQYVVHEGDCVRRALGVVSQAVQDASRCTSDPHQFRQPAHGVE